MPLQERQKPAGGTGKPERRRAATHCPSSPEPALRSTLRSLCPSRARARPQHHSSLLPEPLCRVSPSPPRTLPPGRRLKFSPAPAAASRAPASGRALSERFTQMIRHCRQMFEPSLPPDLRHRGLGSSVHPTQTAEPERGRAGANPGKHP